VKKYSFKIFKFHADTKKIELTASFKTKAITRERLDEVIRLELLKFGSNVCYHVVGEL
jgi:hypothetical protein